MILEQIIVPVYLPMPGGDVPAEDANILLIVLIGSLCFLIGFVIGMWVEYKFI